MKKLAALALILFATSATPALGSYAYASWFGPGLYGNRQACGSILTPYTWGVAHKSLPCGTRVTICYRRCVRVPVTDRGPFVGGRTFDLTARTARHVGLTGVKRIRWYR